MSELSNQCTLINRVIKSQPWFLTSHNFFGLVICRLLRNRCAGNIGIELWAEMVGNLYFRQVIFAKKIWMSTYLPCRETISFYISNIIELPSLEQRTTTSTTTGYFWYVHVIYPGLQMYQKCKQTINCYLAEVMCVYIRMTSPTAQISTSNSYCFLDESYEIGLAFFFW